MELTIEQALQQGIAAHKEGKLEEAKSLYRTILQSQPLNPDANHNLGVLAVSVNKADVALPLFKIALEANPKIEQFWLSYIDCLIKEKQLKTAKAVLEQGRKVGLVGDKVDALEGQLGVSVVSIDNIESSSDELTPAIKFREAGKFQEAQEWLQKLIESQPNHAEAFSLLCHVLLLDKKDVEAERALLTAASINSELASIYLNQARLLLKQSNPEGALQKAQIGHDCSGNDPESWLVLAACLNANQRSQEALDLIEKVLLSNPNHAEAHATRAFIQFNSKDIIGAIADADMAVSVKPHLTQVWRLLGSLHYENKNLSEAIKALKKVHELEPTDVNCMFNLGEFLRQDKRVSEAIAILEKAAEMAPKNINIWINLGTAFQQDEQIDKAKAAYEKALAINPKSAEISNNLGSIAKDACDWMSALQYFEKALDIKPEFTEAHRNIGLTLYGGGDFSGAIEAYKQALKIEPNNAEIWNCLQFPLQAIKLQIPDVEELLSTLNPQADSKHFQIAKSILSFKLNLGGENVGSALNKVCSLLSTADDNIIKNQEVMNSDSHHKTIEPDKIVALVHFGRSGTGLLHSLIDHHPQVSTMPSIYFSEFFNHSTWEKIVSGGWSKMVDCFIATYEVLFDASARSPILTKNKKYINYLGQKDGMANVGDQRDEVLRVNKALFGVELKRLMALHDHLDAFAFFKLAHAAYDKALKDSNHKKLIFYHIHNPDSYAQLNFANGVPNANWIMMVREPIQACESWIRRSFDNDKYAETAGKVFTMLFELDNVIYQKQNSIGLRLEDLKESPKKTISALCDWLGIEETASLYEMTAQGKKWWGDPISPDYAKEGMEPFGKTSIRRKVGLVFTENDQFILRTLFYPFSMRFGYVEENLEQFKADLKTIRPMLDKMFGFEKTMSERTQVDAEQFMKSGSYLHLRSGLIERWNVLAEFHTYPNMIEPLKITFPQ